MRHIIKITLVSKMLTHLLLILSLIPSSFYLQIAVAEASKTTFTFGYLRMATPGIDSPNTLAGYQALIRHANENNDYPHAQFVLNVTTIDCRSVAACGNLTMYQQQQITTFLDAMKGYTAVLKPNYLLTLQVLKRSTELGKVPILGESGVQALVYEKGYEHMINFNHNRSRSADHLFTYMQLKLNCAYSGIMHGSIASAFEADRRQLVEHIQERFAAIGLARPPPKNVQTATDAQLADFVMNDEPRRRCFIVIATNAVLMETLARLGKMPSYVPSRYSFLGLPMAASDFFLINGSANLTSNVAFTYWSPPDVSPAVRNAFGVWKSSPLAVDLQAFAPAETIPTGIEFFTVQASLVIRLAMEVISTVASQSASLALSLCNSSSSTVGPPIPWANITDGFYQGGRVIDGYKFASLVRSCPIQPQKQICYCNSVSVTSYIYKINSTTGKPEAQYDDVDAGEREVASLEFPNFCGYEASSWSYPITGVVVYPTSVTGTSSLRADEVADVVNLYQHIFRELTNDINYATVKHPRPFRYAAISTNPGQLSETVFDQYLDGLRPYMLFGSMAERINRSDVLTLVPALMEIETEDPVLVPHGTGPDGWQWNVLQLEPSLADLIHGLVAYFADVMSDDASGLNALDGKPKFTSIHALASTQREAELISMSFATWGYNVLVSDVVVSDSASVWAERTSSWLSNDQSSNPFVLVASTLNPNSVIISSAFSASSANKGTTAMACSISVAHSASVTVTLAPSFSSSKMSADVIFATMGSEFWMRSASNYPPTLRGYIKNPRFHLAYLTMKFAEQIAGEVWYDFETSAAKALYARGSINSNNLPFGPFYNNSCSAAQIKTNARNRRCQCTKGARSVYAHSLRAYVAGTYSDFTGRFSWTMSTCGVVYTPYVPPAEPSSLSSGAVAGIAIGGSVLIIAATAGYILSVCFLGRNNRNAPKDPTKPFAVVFTDIQSSTALWSRAPAAMSDAIEYHHELMRKTLRRNRGYEVKTVGDSFMIAFHEADDAVRFTLEAQVAFNEADWNQEIDAIYIELLAEAEANNENIIDKDVSKDTEGSTDRGNYPITGSLMNAFKKLATSLPGSPEVGPQPDRSPKSMSIQVFAQKHSTSVSIVDSAAAMQYNHRSQSSQRTATDVKSHQTTSATGVLPPSMLFYKVDNVANHSIVSAHALVNILENNSATFGGHFVSVNQHVGQSTNSKADIINIFEANVPQHSEISEDPSMWHGLRVRMGVHYGMGDIRKDAVTLGYDYYGTVVNTAARVEGVGHGGQTLVTEEAYNALSHTFKDDALVIALGHQPLRGLDAPVKLFQFLPSQLNLRKFPQLRLHIEKETEDTSTTNTGTATGTGNGSQTTDVETVDDMVAKLFASSKQFKMTSPDEVLYNQHFLTTIFAPVKEKFRNNVITKLAESWGFDKSAINAGMSNGNANKLRFFVNFVAKMTKTFVVGGRKSGHYRRSDKQAANAPLPASTDNKSIETNSMLSDLSKNPNLLPQQGQSKTY